MFQYGRNTKGLNAFMINQREDFTYRLLMDAGIKKGFRVLDVGCGSGDVTFIDSSNCGR